MKLDRAAWDEALAHYRAWNEAEFVDRVRNAGQRTPADKWQEYRSLFAFTRRIKPQCSPGEQQLTAWEWAAYYERMHRFETRRQSRG